MSSTALNIAKELRPALTRLYLLYFRKTDNSNISMAQLSILMILGQHGPLRISQVAAMESIRMPTASNAINQLETMGMLTRTRDVSDRRGVRVELTDKGHEELNRMAEDRALQLASMLEGLTDEELAKTEELVPVIQMILDRFSAATEEELEAEESGH